MNFNANIRWIAVIGAVVGLPSLLVSQTKEESCRDVLLRALHNRNLLPDSGLGVQRSMTMTTVRFGPNGLDTVVQQIESVESEHIQVLRFDSVEVWSGMDGKIIRNDHDRTITVIDLRPQAKILSGQKRLNSLLPDSLVHHAEGISCETLSPNPTSGMPEAVDNSNHSIRTRIKFDIVPHMQRFYNARAIMVDVGASGEIMRFYLDHPANSVVLWSEYVVHTVDRSVNLKGIKNSRAQFLTKNGELKEDYQAYQLIKQ